MWSDRSVCLENSGTLTEGAPVFFFRWSTKKSVEKKTVVLDFLELSLSTMPPTLS